MFLRLHLHLCLRHRLSVAVPEVLSMDLFLPEAVASFVTLSLPVK